jgi:S-adenosylmethionine-diacylglycerol 3-amino-3-carboxypropyl transferase
VLKTQKKPSAFIYKPMNQNFFGKINYSASNEDSESERRSLTLNNNDTVLCITGSGSRPLDLLIDCPKKIISIDFNKTQNFLLELKIAAYKSLSYAQFSAFIGLTHSSSRILTFEKIKHELTEKAMLYWTSNQQFLNRGVLYCGTWEKLLKQMLKFSKPRANLINALMTSDSLEEQQMIWTKKWDNNLWDFYLKIISNRFLWKHIIREPGFRLIPKSFNVFTYMKERLNFMGTQINMKQSHFANLLFYGKYKEDCLLPQHLREENFEIIKQNLHKLEIISESLTNYLSRVSDQITAFSLSDFSSYTDDKTYNNTWKVVINSAKDEAKFCERQFLIKKDPEFVFSEIRRNSQLENTLLHADESFIYSFCVGKIIKS